MNLNPICHPSPAKKWSAHFWIMFNFWWLARLVNGLEPHLPPMSSQRMKCSFLDYIQLLMIGRAGRWTRTSCTTPLQAKKWNAHFWITFNFWWLAGLVNGFKHHLPPVSSQKNEMPIFWLLSISGDQPGWSMDSNRIHNPSPAKKVKCSFLDYVQLLMIGQLGQWTRTPSATSLQPRKWNAHFWFTFNFWWLAGLVDGLKPHLWPPLQPKKWNAHFCIMLTSDHLWPLSNQKNEMLICLDYFNFWLCYTSDDQLGWLMDLNPICHPSQAKKVKCLFLDCFQFLVISQAGRWTQTPSTTPLQPKNKMLIFGLHSTSYDWPGWSMDSNPICNLSPTKKMKCSFLDYVQLLMISQAGQRTRNLSATCLEPKK